MLDSKAVVLCHWYPGQRFLSGETEITHATVLQGSNAYNIRSFLPDPHLFMVISCEIRWAFILTPHFYRHFAHSSDIQEYSPFVKLSGRTFQNIKIAQEISIQIAVDRRWSVPLPTTKEAAGSDVILNSTINQ